MHILGISAFYHDSAAALVSDGVIRSAVQEERFTRKRHDSDFPRNAVRSVLKQGGISVADIDLIVFYEKPRLKLERLLSTYIHHAPRGWESFKAAAPLWLQFKGWTESTIRKELGFQGPVEYVTHHLGHAASAFFASPFSQAAYLTVDGVGESETTTWGIGDGSSLEMKQHILFPDSLGLLYSALTYYLGFKVNSGEYKVMGLAPYGRPIYAQKIFDELIDIKEDGSFKLSKRYFDFELGLSMITPEVEKLFGFETRRPESHLTNDHMDIAASLQVVLEEAMLRMARDIRKRSECNNLCLAGGVALNCVANGKIHKEKIFDNIWIQPASGDAGGALGAALYGYHVISGRPRVVPSRSDQDAQQGSLLGPSFDEGDIKSFLELNRIPYRLVSDVAQETAQLLSEGGIIGWFSGRMEFGPRSLGARSLLGDARVPDMQKRMNLKIKFRESFRPFAPVVLREDVNEYFDFDDDSPYMLMVAPVKESLRIPMSEKDAELFGIDKLNVVRSTIPAITHVDYSARIQTVDKQRNPPFYKLLQEFKKITGCSVLINTSFNVRGEPIVCSPEDAFRCFLRTDIDHLVLERFIISKSAFDVKDLDRDWEQEFELD